MDGIGWFWMTLSQLGNQSHLLLRFGFSAGLAGLDFLQKKSCIMVHTV